ncbi:hypothetical protein EDB83DRAFT_2218647 [Lactarius deliciosus]|nr:hypothetical protein EDB83DRAFT_2218647 [Lactarius deliciosus]
MSPAWSREASHCPYIALPASDSARSIHRSSHHHHGTSAEYLVASVDFVVHVPNAWSFEDASQLGVVPLTAL